MNTRQLPSVQSQWLTSETGQQESGFAKLSPSRLTSETWNRSDRVTCKSSRDNGLVGIGRPDSDFGTLVDALLMDL